MFWLRNNKLSGGLWFCLGPARPPFYSTAPVGSDQLQYPDIAHIGHVGLPVRPGSEMSSDVTRQEYSEQQ